MKVRVEYEDSENVYYIPIMKLIKELKLKLTEDKVKKAIIAILGRE